MKPGATTADKIPSIAYPPAIAEENPKTDKAAAPAISAVHLSITGIFIPTIFLATIATNNPIIIAKIKPNIGPAISNPFNLRAAIIPTPAKAPITPIPKDM